MKCPHFILQNANLKSDASVSSLPIKAQEQTMNSTQLTQQVEYTNNSLLKHSIFLCFHINSQIQKPKQKSTRGWGTKGGGRIHHGNS